MFLTFEDGSAAVITLGHLVRYPKFTSSLHVFCLLFTVVCVQAIYL